jgi:manganese transport protein
MLVIAARLFSGAEDAPSVNTLDAVHAQLGQLLDNRAALVFALALLAAGFASSSVGTYAGQVVMTGFLNRQMPLLLRRVVTLVPALLVLALGVDATEALVWSQVVLSLGIPFALVPLVWLTARADIMGDFVNRRSTTGAATVVATLIVGLNVFLLLDLAF